MITYCAKFTLLSTKE